MGTAQFGMDYGVTNQRGRIPKTEIREILRYCYKNYIHTIDTAANYGNSEEILGELISNRQFNIYSKIPHLNVSIFDNKELNAVEKTFFRSLNKLKVNQMEGIFVHNADNLLAQNSDKLFHLIMKWKHTGLIKKVGVSIYDEIQLNSILDHYDIDIFQIPINIYDQRLIHSDILDEIKKRNIEIHARSIFLQGLLLTDPKKLPKKFKSLIPIHYKLESLFLRHELTKLEGALQFILQIKQIDCMLVGINNLHHIMEIVQSLKKLKKETYIDFKDFQINNVTLIDPRRW
ncbi:aldo/keto reductase [Oceanobacillus sp. FSL K6-2867]|uniref:aldo/keto reductase n=1 Tax=Oceanobacillus sp. FSL K6-2867 TaxID=2954748 RepID=UPI0030DC71AD